MATVAGRQRVEAALGEIDAARPEQHRRQRVDREIEDDRQHGADGDQTGLGYPV